MVNKIYLLVFMIMVMGFVSAENVLILEPVRVGECKSLPQADSDSTYSVITGITYPNGTMVFVNYTMDKSGTDYRYSFCNTTDSGYYTIQGKTDTGAWKYKFLANMQGKEYNTVDGIMYFVAFGLLIVIGVFGVIGFLALPYDNNRGNDGSVISINWKKYLKILLGALLYVLFIAVNYFAWNISLGILEFQELGDFFKFMFRFSFIMMYPLLVIIIIFSIAQFVKDRKVEEFIKRNLTVR